MCIYRGKTVCLKKGKMYKIANVENCKMRISYDRIALFTPLIEVI